MNLGKIMQKEPSLGDQIGDALRRVGRLIQRFAPYAPTSPAAQAMSKELLTLRDQLTGIGEGVSHTVEQNKELKAKVERMEKRIAELEKRLP